MDYVPIRDDIFIVSGPAIAVLEKEYLEIVGVQPTVDADGVILNNGLNEVRTVGLPIFRLASIISNGFNVNIVNQEDITTIYKLCSSFIEENRSINKSGIYKVYEDEFIDLIDNLKEEIVTKHKRLLEVTMPKESFNYLKDALISFDSPKQQNDDVPYVNKSSVGLY